MPSDTLFPFECVAIIYNLLLVLWYSLVVALGVDRLRNYWDRDNFDVARLVVAVSYVSRLLNILFQVCFVAIAQGYDREYAQASCAVAFFHLVEAVTSNIANGYRRPHGCLNFLLALKLFGLAHYSINFECDISVPAFLLCAMMFRTLLDYDGIQSSD